ncbi:MAG: hypothetical protein IPK79_00250 [Vampirovibrionales bacterium]|nr:hypothetical protein [Vampirovibrionales bacterium]
MNNTLTNEQRAARRAKRKNGKLIRSMPLFADALRPDGAMASWLTTPEQELPAVERNRQQAREFGDRMRAKEEKERQQEAEERAKAIEGKTPEQIAFLEKGRQAYPPFGDYGATFWRKSQQPGFLEAQMERMADLQRRGETVRARIAVEGIFRTAEKTHPDWDDEDWLEHFWQHRRELFDAGVLPDYWFTLKARFGDVAVR